MLARYGQFIILFWIIVIVSSCAAKPLPSTLKITEPTPVPLQSSAKMPLPPIVDGIEGNKVYKVISDVPQYIVGPGDVLEISLRQRAEAKPQNVVVRPDGTISISFLDDVKVAGLTASQIHHLLVRELDRYVKDPRLDVLVKEFNSKKASLFGEINILQTGVSGPGNYPLKGKTTLIDLLVGAGGAKNTADLKVVKLLRGGNAYTMNLYQAMFEGDIQQNVILDAGDVVIIPELSTLADKVIVLGEVHNPGVYPFKHQIDVVSAVALAGGYSIDATKASTIVIRRDPANASNVEVVQVDLEQLLKKGDLRQNMSLQSGDIVYVPRKFIADLNYTITQIIPLLDLLAKPAIYRDLYTTGGGLRINTGFSKTQQGTSTIFTVPVTGGGVP